MFRSRNAKDIKSYLYISKTKVDSFYHQFKGRPDDGNFSFQWKFDVATVVSMSIGAAEEAAEPYLEDKLRQIIQVLEKSGQVGTIERPLAFIQGVFPMRWGIFDDSGLRPDNEGPLVYFGGLKENMLLGLGGSSKHIEGYQGIGGTTSRSHTRAIVDFLFDGLDSGEIPKWPGELQRDREAEVYTAMAVAQHYLKPPTQELEFLAKTLSVGHAYGVDHMIGIADAHAVLATPIYVAHTKRPQDSNHWGLIPEDVVSPGQQ